MAVRSRTRRSGLRRFGTRAIFSTHYVSGIPPHATRIHTIHSRTVAARPTGPTGPTGVHRHRLGRPGPCHLSHRSPASHAPARLPRPEARGHRGLGQSPATEVCRARIVPHHRDLERRAHQRSDHGRYQSAADLQNQSGIAPITQQSGKSQIVHSRHACPQFHKQDLPRIRRPGPPLVPP